MYFAFTRALSRLRLLGSDVDGALSGWRVERNSSASDCGKVVWPGRIEHAIK